MKNSVMLTIASLLLLLLLTFHLADDIRRGFEPGGLANLVGIVLISVVWLYGTLVLAERRSGYIIMLLLSLFSLVVPYVHMKGRGVGITSKIANFRGHFFFVWTLLAIGVIGLFSPPSSRGADCGACHGDASLGSPTTRTWKGPSHCVGDPARIGFCLN
jgi:hypothetical protein